MATRRKSSMKDLKLEQGKRRDAYFERLRRQSQPRRASAAPAAVQAPTAAPAPPPAVQAPAPSEAPAAE